MHFNNSPAAKPQECVQSPCLSCISKKKKKQYENGAFDLLRLNSWRRHQLVTPAERSAVILSDHSQTEGSLVYMQHPQTTRCPPPPPTQHQNPSPSGCLNEDQALGSDRGEWNLLLCTTCTHTQRADWLFRELVRKWGGGHRWGWYLRHGATSGHQRTCEGISKRRFRAIFIWFIDDKIWVYTIDIMQIYHCLPPSIHIPHPSTKGTYTLSELMISVAICWILLFFFCCPLSFCFGGCKASFRSEATANMMRVKCDKRSNTLPDSPRTAHPLLCWRASCCRPPRPPHPSCWSGWCHLTGCYHGGPPLCPASPRVLPCRGRNKR